MCNEIGACGDSLVAQDKDVVMITVLYILIFRRVAPSSYFLFNFRVDLAVY